MNTRQPTYPPPPRASPRSADKRTVCVFSSPDLAGVPYAPVARSENESDERYVERGDALDLLFGHR